ncbi:TPA: DUF3850 domain-containing protein [Klebsiella pneumoniae]|uniref:DUF3850 domain-containing protein n=1 Tax=Klebsiella pneumoniae TaxID=573 RepID=UPI0015D597B1|nr:DUF3850 domain-containing protein [Klebsiella pneumoniae]HCI6075646.1 DUF3850 domain-containing protein [Klebsiella pneumoniae]
MTKSTITREPITHDLKIFPEFFSAVCTGVKRAELRKNDRDYRVGDTLHLTETPRGSCHQTGEFINVKITHIADVGEWMPGYVLLSVELQERRKSAMDSEPAAPVAEIVSIYGDPEAFGEREIRPLVGIQQMPYGTKLYLHAQPVVEIEPMAEVLSNRPGNDTSTIDRALPVGTQLYRQAQQPVVPEEWTIADAVKFCKETGRQDAGSAMDAWNACRAAMLQELKKSAGTEATCRSNENVQAVEVQSLTSINPAPELVSFRKKAESIIGNYLGIPDGSEHCPCCGKKLRRTCSVEGCGGKHVAHGLCQKHYDMQRWEDPEQVERFREAGRRYRGKKKSTVATPQEPKP